jgi:hypothetical protein
VKSCISVMKMYFPNIWFYPYFCFQFLYIIGVKSLTTSKTYIKANCTALSQEKVIFSCIYLNIYNIQMLQRKFISRIICVFDIMYQNFFKGKTGRFWWKLSLAWSRDCMRAIWTKIKYGQTLLVLTLQFQILLKSH